MVVHAIFRKMIDDDDVENTAPMPLFVLFYISIEPHMMLLVETHVLMIYSSSNLVYSSMQCHNHQLLFTKRQLRRR